MISTKLLNLTLDNIRQANPVAEFAENLHNQGVTEEQLAAALNGRNDSIAVELVNCHRDIQHGVPSTNKYGCVGRAKTTKRNRI